MNLSKREKYILVAAAALIALALARNFVIKPIFKKWNRIDSEIIAKKITLRRDLKLLENRNAIIKEYNTYTASSRGISKILSYIEKEAGSLGIKTANIRPMPVVQKGLYEEYVIELQIEGMFPSINKFVAGLIKPSIAIAVKKFDLRALADSPSFFKGTLILSKISI